MEENSENKILLEKLIDLTTKGKFVWTCRVRSEGYLKDLIFTLEFGEYSFWIQYISQQASPPLPQVDIYDLRAFNKSKYFSIEGLDNEKKKLMKLVCTLHEEKQQSINPR